MMPPSGAPPPRRGQRSTRLPRSSNRGSIAPPIRQAALETPALHRLNRTEYANAIRDLLALDVDVNALAAGDGSSEGFDNLAEALAVSPSLIQGYVSAAMKISRLAVGDRTLAPSQVTFAPPAGLAQDRHIDGLPLGTRGGMLIHHTFPLDAEYEFAVGGRRGGGGPGVDVTLDGEQVTVDNPRSFRLNVSAGPHTIGLSLPDRQRGAGVDEIYSDFRDERRLHDPGGVPRRWSSPGPFNATGAGDTPSRRSDLRLPAGDRASEETACARTILIDARAPRLSRPGQRRRDRHADGVLPAGPPGRRLRDRHPAGAGAHPGGAALPVPHRGRARHGRRPARRYRISDLELASRLSFFLWSSIPDDELLDAGGQGPAARSAGRSSSR